MKISLLAVLANLFAFDGVHNARAFERGFDCFESVGKKVDVDVGAAPHVARQRAADEPRTKRLKQPHHPQRLDPHIAQIVGAAIPLVQSGKVLNLVADFRVAGKIFGFDPTAANSFGGPQLGPKVFRFLPLIHQSRRFERDLPPKLFVVHQRWCAETMPIQAAPG